MMKNTNISSISNNTERVNFQDITEQPLNERPEFFHSAANNPFIGRLDSVDVRQGLFKVIDIKEDTVTPYTTGTGATTYKGFNIPIPFSTIKNYRSIKSPRDLMVWGWVELDGGNVVPIGYVGFTFTGATTYMFNSFQYYISTTAINLQLNSGATLPAQIKYKLYILAPTV